jgi:hypothetical protein
MMGVAFEYDLERAPPKLRQIAPARRQPAA